MSGSDSYDAVIVGAGHNAMAAAIHLLAKGWSVALFERGDAPGGCVATAEAAAQGFRSDLAAMNLSLFAGSPFHGTYGEELAARGLGFVPAAHPFATAFPDGTWLGVSTDLEQTAARIAALSPEDAQTWRDMVADFPGEAELIGGLLGTPMTRGALVRFAWKAWRAKGAPWMLDTVRFLLSSPRAFLEDRFESPKVQAMMAAWGMHLDFAPSIAGGAVFPYLESMANQCFGMVIGQGGAASMGDAMAQLVRDKGGVIETGAEVTRILHENGTATGVELASGRVIRATRAVIGGLTPSALVRMTGSTGSERFDRAATRFAHAPGTMMIHLAMEDLPDWSAGAELRDFAYVHLAPSLGAMDLAYAQARAGLLPTEPVVVVGQPTVVDPSRAPEGKHILWLQVRMAPGDIAGDAAGQIDATDWAGAKAPFAERILDLLERYAPGTRDRIIGQSIHSPADLEAWNPNLVGGDQVAGSHHLSQNFLFRPVRGHSDWSTPLKGLHMVGASTWPGGGTGAGSGYMLARKLAGD